MRFIQKSAVCCTLVCLIITPILRAQQIPPGGDLAGRIAFITQTLHRLDLTPDQSGQIDDILTRLKSDAGLVIDQIKDLPPDQKVQRANAFMNRYRPELLAVLTPDQRRTVLSELARGAAQGQGLPFQRLQTAIGRLDLTSDQQQKVATLIEETRAKLKVLRQKLAQTDPSDLQELRGETQDLTSSVRARLQDILTPQQQEKLRQLMTADPAAGSAAGKSAAIATAGLPANAAAREPTSQPASKLLPTGALAPGFHLRSLDNRVIDLSQYKGHLVVLEFGSLSSPTFRDHAEEMDRLRLRSAGVTFLIVYTAEAYPSDTWDIDRNEKDDIRVRKATSESDRRAAALQARDRLNIEIPILLDSTDDAVARAYGAFPNGAVVIGPDQTIVAGEQWCDPSGLAEAISEAKNIR